MPDIEAIEIRSGCADALTPSSRTAWLSFPGGFGIVSQVFCHLSQLAIKND